MVFASLITIMLAAVPAFSTIPPHKFHFDGNWMCEGTFRNGRTHKARYHGASTIGGTWTELDETDVEPAGYIGKYLIGVDRPNGHIIEFDANNAGYAVYESYLGWDGDTLTMTLTDLAKAKLPNRFVYTVHDATTFTIDWQIQQNTTWLTADHLTCNPALSP